MMAPCDPLDLVVPDPNAAKTAEQRAMVQKAKAEGRKKLDKYVKALHQLGESIEESIEE